MKTALVLLLTAFASLNAFSTTWTPSVTCDNGAFEIDRSYDHASTAVSQQVVIRNGGTLSYFQSLVPGPLAINAKQELVISATPLQNDEIQETMLDQKSSADSATGVFFNLAGHWLEGGRYEVQITSLSHYPGMTDVHATVLGNWIFNGCHAL